ncbi:ABC transporter ATP-binding protein [Thermicanus aegyptius]|uniref:ABC transporter ATP-binding protein n=1 Tax=Thermicanus aegyptius TaxID=94009 RepID=UPI0004146B94|nr:ABC transporter ATP-binding protein [Thermicanus aegyptius]
MLTVKQLNIEVLQGKRWHSAVEQIGFTLEQGEILGIIGESGSGKSLTAKAIANILPRQARIASGEIYFLGHNLVHTPRTTWSRLYGQELSVIFQNPMTALNPVMRIGKQLTDAYRTHHRCSEQEAKRVAMNTLSLVGIHDPDRVYRSYPHELSGGMKQRVMIAIAVINKPRLLIADEPTTALDATIRKQILDLFLKLRKEMNLSILLISHDLGTIGYLCDQVLVLYGGRLLEKGSRQNLLTHPLHPYTKALLDAVPRMHGPLQLVGIPGSVPNITEAKKGCIFAARCNYARSICAEIEPELTATTLPQGEKQAFYACHFPLKWEVRRETGPQPEERNLLVGV